MKRWYLIALQNKASLFRRRNCGSFGKKEFSLSLFLDQFLRKAWKSLSVRNIIGQNFVHFVDFKNVSINQLVTPIFIAQNE